MTGGYRALFSHPGAGGLALASLVGRLPNGMLGLAFVLTLVKATGSYGAGGAAAGCYTLTAAVLGPLWSRAVDRIGPRAVLLVTGTGQALVLATVSVLAARTDNRVVLIGLTAASGVLLPPLGAIMRALWSRMLADEPDAKAAAFAYESVVVDIVFIVGPSVVAGLAALAGPTSALFCAAVATAVGCVLVASSRHVAEAHRNGGAGGHWLGPLRSPAVLGLLPVGFLVMGSISVIEVSLVAFADDAGQRNASGALIAVLSVGGVLGGLYQGSRRQPGTHGQQLVVLLAALATGWALLAVFDNVWLLGCLLVVAGLALNPAITAQYSTMDDIAPQEALTESFGWLNALGSAGSSAGAAVAGVVVESGAGGGFLLAAGCCGLGCAIALSFQRTWRRGVPEVQRDDAPSAAGG
ncbi:MFS transporter [Streptomyces sp. I05A-00742]|uniref:MFS transporter n=1 Tax=Streptomyces sp. I05A-00742 TaxID=2732853 RepID=UPI001489E7BC|nr:MFS transporter [Streptomyces sp. I05A-00742]